MKASNIAIIVILAWASPTIGAAETPAEYDRVQIANCDELPTSASIEVFTKSETLGICREMMKTLEGVTVSDLRSFSKAAYLLSAKGYKERNYLQITQELVNIIRLRGLYNQQPRWFATLDLVYRSWTAFNGAIGPNDIQSFLRAADPDAAKSLSDDGLTSMIIVMKNQRQKGND